MAGLTPGPEDAEKQHNGADSLASSTHSQKAIPADVLARVAVVLNPARRHRWDCPEIG
jgi:hypothetical protein